MNENAGPGVEWTEQQKGEVLMGKQFVTVKEVQEAMGISEGKAYAVIRELNSQLRAKGFITIAGKVNKAYFEEKCCYGGVAAGE